MTCLLNVLKNIKGVGVLKIVIEIIQIIITGTVIVTNIIANFIFNIEDVTNFKGGGAYACGYLGASIVL